MENLKIKKYIIYNLDDYIFIYNARLISSSDESITLFQFGFKYPTSHVVFKLKNQIIGGQN